MDERDLELGFKLQLENVAAAEKFEEVLDTAIETCLQDTTVYEAALKAVEYANQETASLEGPIANSLGSWGLRAAVDVSQYPGSFYAEAFDDLPHPLTLDLLREPTIVPLRADKSVQQKIEAFGQAIIHEAFTCLGEDAPEKARQFAASADADEQYDILLWLYERIGRIRELMPIDEPEPVIEDIPEPTLKEVDDDVRSRAEAEGDPVIVDFSFDLNEPDPMDAQIAPPTPRSIQTDQDDEGNYFYHPTRLSPKLIGTFPDNHIRTTCLGVSVLAASFFNAAGADYVHAGVMETALENSRMTQMQGIFQTLNVADDSYFGLNETADKNLNDILDSIDKLRRADRGHHALTAVRLVDASWVNFDPNYNALDRLKDRDNTDLNDAYAKLVSLEKVEPGINLIQRSGEGRYSEFFLWAIDDLNQLDPNDLEADLDQIMGSGDLIEGLKTYLLETAGHLPTFETIFDIFVALSKDKDKAARADRLFGQCVERYFMAGMSPEDMAARYGSDQAFRKRRQEDFAMLPYMMLLKSLSEFAHLQTKGLTAPAATLEVGMPSYRIGACVLSDFSMYLGNEIPLSFWVSNWTSHVAVEGHLPAENDESAQADLGRRMSSILRSGLLRNFNSYGIIHRFLEQGVNKTDGNQQG